MLIPRLLTPRLELIAPDADCDDLYRRFYTDAEASAFYGGPLSPGAAASRLAHDLGVWHLHGFGVWVLRRREDGSRVGVCGFWQGLGWPRELTWWLLPQARGQGLAAEASRAAVRHAYEGFGWDRVETYMADENVAARALVHRLGGQRVRRQVFPDGRDRDVFLIPRPV